MGNCVESFVQTAGYGMEIALLRKLFFDRKIEIQTEQKMPTSKIFFKIISYNFNLIIS